MQTPEPIPSPNPTANLTPYLGPMSTQSWVNNGYHSTINNPPTPSTGKGKGKGKGKSKGNKSGNGVYQMDTEGAMNRLTLLIGGKKAGNTSQAIKQEASTILDWLLNNNKIDLEEHKLLTQEINS